MGMFDFRCTEEKKIKKFIFFIFDFHIKNILKN